MTDLGSKGSNTHGIPAYTYRSDAIIIKESSLSMLMEDE